MRRDGAPPGPGCRWRLSRAHGPSDRGAPAMAFMAPLLPGSWYDPISGRGTKNKRPAFRRALDFSVAERMGFEPMVEFYPHTRLAGEHLQPARSSLRMGGVAEGVGFEPTEVLPSTVFKTAAFDHSAIPPNL